MLMLKRGDVCIANLGISSGSEQRGTRPVLVIQNNTGNHFSTTVIVASFTDARKKPMPTHVFVTSAETGFKLPKDSVVLLEQIRTIDKAKIDRKICTLSDERMEEVDDALKVSLDLKDSARIQKLEKRLKDAELQIQLLTPVPPSKFCTVDDCGKAAIAKGMCRNHYQKAYNARRRAASSRPRDFYSAPLRSAP